MNSRLISFLASSSYPTTSIPYSGRGYKSGMSELKRCRFQRACATQSPSRTTAMNVKVALPNSLWRRWVPQLLHFFVGGVFTCLKCGGKFIAHIRFICISGHRKRSEGGKKTKYVCSSVPPNFQMYAFEEKDASALSHNQEKAALPMNKFRAQ